MTTWVIVSETDEPDGALAIVRDLRDKGYKAWIEDEIGKPVNEETLRSHSVEPAKSRDTLIAILIWAAAVVVGFSVLYVLGLWVDREL